MKATHLLDHRFLKIPGLLPLHNRNLNQATPGSAKILKNFLLKIIGLKEPYKNVVPSY
ncbi:MAG TPA: hypothetical protein VIK59_06225 [Verrucomicrobiae bacterium]